MYEFDDLPHQLFQHTLCLLGFFVKTDRSHSMSRPASQAFPCCALAMHTMRPLLCALSDGSIHMGTLVEKTIDCTCYLGDPTQPLQDALAATLAETYALSSLLLRTAQSGAKVVLWGHLCRGALIRHALTRRGQLQL